MRWVRHSNSEGNSESWPTLYHWLATYDYSNDPIDTMRYRAWKALSYRNEPVLSEQVAREFYKSPWNERVSQIETISACPFKHFVTYGLHLTEREDQEITAIDLGNVCHGILERIVRQMLKERSGWKTPPPALVNELAQQLGKELRGELMLSSARNQYILKHIEKTIDQALAAQSAVGKRGRFTPWRAELQFGDGREIPALKLQTPQGRELKLKGKIDRVDRVEGQAAFAVIDYKYRGSTLALDWVYHGLSLQLLAYLLVLQNSGIEKDHRLTPAAAFYVKLLRQLEKVDHPADATKPDDPLFDLTVKPRGIIDWNRRDLIDPDIKESSDLVQLLREEGQDDGPEELFRRLRKQRIHRDAEQSAAEARGAGGWNHERHHRDRTLSHRAGQPVLHVRLSEYLSIRCEVQRVSHSPVDEAARMCWSRGGGNETVKWTKEQFASITTTGQSLLVSAAAGSGKTAVLAERCAHLVCDAPGKCDLDELLVVTFTKAAATEMKSRIEAARASDWMQIPMIGD